MSDPLAKSCDDVRLNLYLDGELGANETEWMDAHLKDCADCRQKATTVVSFTRTFQRRVKDAAETVDFVAIEKQVIKKTLPRYISRSAFVSLFDALKYIVPVMLVGGFLLFYIYTRYIDDPTPETSAIIDSFSGPVQSLFIFETPRMKETILWYNEKTDMENENDAL